MLLVQCGGTIDKDYPSGNHGYAFDITDSAAVSWARGAVPCTLSVRCRRELLHTNLFTFFSFSSPFFSFTHSSFLFGSLSFARRRTAFPPNSKARILTAIAPAGGFELAEVCKKDSLEMTDEDRANLLKLCQTTSHTKILITHGTSTMV